MAALDLVDRALEDAATAQMVRLFDILIAAENLGPGLDSFEKGLRELIAAYDAAAAFIVELKAEAEPK